MSDKKKNRFSKEEQEIQEVLSETPQASAESNPETPPPANANLSAECMTKLSEMLASSMGRTLHTVFKDFGFHNEDSEGSEIWSEGEDDEDAHQELPTGWPCHNLDENNNTKKSLPSFGIVNELNSESGSSSVNVTK